MANKKARVLVATTIGEKQYQANDIVSVDEKELASYAGSLDADPEAVKYAESLKRKPAAED